MSYKGRMQRAFPVWKGMLKRATPFIRVVLVDGGAAGNVAVTAIRKGDQLVSVIESDTSDSSLTDRTTDFIVGTTKGQIIALDGYINNTGGTETSSDKLIVTWIAWSQV